MISIKIIFKVLGRLLLIEGIFLLISFGVALLYGGFDWQSLLLSAGIVLAVGGGISFFTKKTKPGMGRREAYIIVSMVWVVFSFFGCLPFVFSGAIPSFTNAFFETISGFTTTGASILNDIEALPHGLLFWRSITQWLGGMGIIVMSLAVLPVLGIGGMQLFVAEVPGPTPDKLHPRIHQTAKRLWAIYILFTFSETLLLWAGGMSFFDAINHAFTTMATGGYSTKQASIAFYQSPFIQYVIIVFMFLAGTNFSLAYFAFQRKFSKIWGNEEFRYYLGFVVGFTLLISIGLVFFNTKKIKQAKTTVQHSRQMIEQEHESLEQALSPQEYQKLEQALSHAEQRLEATDEKPAQLSARSIESAFRESLFQVVSIMTTTGYATTDYLKWTPILWVLLFVLMFFGGSAGSTGGGIKIVRILLLMKNSALEFKRLIHPHAVIPVRLNHKAVDPQIVTNVLAFIVVYIIIFVLGTVVMTFFGLNLDSAMGAVIASLGNIGPGIGSVGPAENFFHIPASGKWVLSFLMLIGRLELFTVLILIAPAFWKL